MNVYLEPQGFLGTGASLLADITLLAYLLLIVPGMLIGFVFARRKMFRPYHKYTMTTIMIVNWLLIIFLMLAAFTFDVSGNIAQQPGNARYLMPVIHGILGLSAQLLGSYVVFRMFREDAQKSAAKKRGEKDLSRYYFNRAKTFMRVTLALWLLTALLGIGNYVVRYEVLPAFNLGSAPAAPVETQEPEPEVTQTPEPVTTSEPSSPPPAATSEPEAPAATEEASS